MVSSLAAGPCGRARGPAAGVAERCRSVTVAGSCAGSAARAVAERLGSVAVGSDRAGGPAAGVAERGLVLSRCGRGCGEQERGAEVCEVAEAGERVSVHSALS